MTHARRVELAFRPTISFRGPLALWVVEAPTHPAQPADDLVPLVGPAR